MNINEILEDVEESLILERHTFNGKGTIAAINIFAYVVEQHARTIAKDVHLNDLELEDHLQLASKDLIRFLNKHTGIQLG
jgi:hypothetical protein